MTAPLSYFRLLLLPILLAGCSLYDVRIFESADPNVPNRFISATETPGKGESASKFWWEEYNDPNLNTLIQTALAENYSLKAAWSRLRQAQERVVITGSDQYPQVDVGGDASRTRFDQDGSGDDAGRTTYENSFVFRSGLSFEVDLWKRIASARSADENRAASQEAEVENSALLLSGLVAELWFRAQEQKALLLLLEEQLDAGRKQLGLIELRFSVGQGTALDVLQQRTQLAATESEVPLAESALEQTLLQLSTLLGKPPGELAEVTPDGNLPGVPEFPTMIKPIDLLRTRPDLRSARFQAQAEEYDLAAAVADRFPRLALGLSYDFSTADISDGFTEEFGRIGANAALPLVDGGRRRAQVRQQEARVDQALEEYSQLFLESLEDVERSLVAEKYQKELLERLDVQMKNAQATLRESRSRYVNGLTDYINVLSAFQSVQSLERRLVSERRELLTARSQLYRAMGGVWDRKETKPSGEVKGAV